MEVRFWHYDRRTRDNAREGEEVLNSAGLFVHEGGKRYRDATYRLIAKFIFSLLKEGEELVVLEPTNPASREAFRRHMEELHKKPEVPLKTEKPRSLISKWLWGASWRELLGKERDNSLHFVCSTPEEMEQLISQVKSKSHYMFYCITKKKGIPFDIILHHRRGYRRVREGGGDKEIDVKDNLWIIVNPHDGAVEVQSERLFFVLDSDTANPKGTATIRITRE